VAEERAVARGQQGGDEVPFLGEKSRRHRGVDAPVHAVHPAGAKAAADRRGADVRGQQLLAGHDAVLPARDHANCFG
jgi:hypothetical protein